MDKDLILFIISLIPLFWIIVFDQDFLSVKSVYLKHFIIAIFVLVIGIWYDIQFADNAKNLFYFGCHVSISFLIVQKPLRNLFYKFTNEEPEVSQFAKGVSNTLYSFILYCTTITLPFIIGTYVTPKIIALF